MKKILFLSLTLLLAACDNIWDVKGNDNKGKNELCDLAFVNDSGVEVAVVMRHYPEDEYYFDFPDSIVLSPGSQYHWDLYVTFYPTKYSPVYHPSPPLGAIKSLKLYFDKKLYKEYDEDRFEQADIEVLDNYVKTFSPDKKYKYLWTYTFNRNSYE